MASALIHICVAKKVADNLKLNMTNEYYIGSIAPDISKLINEDKIKSHFLENSIKENVPNIKKFIDKYGISLDKEFDLGYFIHLYTDKLWFNDFLKKLIYSNSVKLLDGTIVNLTEEELGNIIYNDYSNLNIVLLDEYKLDLSIFYNKYRLVNSNITKVPIEKMQILLDKMGLIISNTKEDKNYIFNLNGINNFIEICTKEITMFLIDKLNLTK